MVIAGVSNYYGVNVSGKVALILSSLLLILLRQLYLWRFQEYNGEILTFVPNGWFSVGNAITVIFWSFFGWEAICNLAEHFKRPEKILSKEQLLVQLSLDYYF